MRKDDEILMGCLFLFLCLPSEKQREFYKNAKYVSKYRKSLKQHTSQQNDASSSAKPAQVCLLSAFSCYCYIRSVFKTKKKKSKISLAPFVPSQEVHESNLVYTNLGRETSFNCSCT